MVTPVPRTTGTISFHSAPKRSRGDIATRERPRHRRRLRTVTIANQTGTAIYAFVNHGKCFAHGAKVAFSQLMSDFDRERDGIWDEYDWERFLQQQDQRTEKYMDLLEKYIDDPNRDEIIAREMGWTATAGAEDWSAEVDALLDEDWRSPDEEAVEPDKASETFE